MRSRFDFARIPAGETDPITVVDGTFTRWLSDPSPVRSKTQIVRDVADYAWDMLDGAARRRGLCLDRDHTVAELIDSVYG